MQENGDFVADIDPATGFTVRELVSSRDIPTNSRTYYFTAKLTGAISQNHPWQITAFGTPESDVQFAGSVRDPGSATTIRAFGQSPQARHIHAGKANTAKGAKDQCRN